MLSRMSSKTKPMRNTAVIMNEGMSYLLEKLGTLETEMFISHILHEPFDYTKWRKDNLYTDTSLDELNQKAAQYSKDHPFRQNNAVS
jgi:hypothetical protein